MNRQPSGSLANVSAGGTYYLNVYALTPKDDTHQEQKGTAGDQQLQISGITPYMIYLPFIIFFALFIAAFGIQMIQRIWSVKRTFTSLILAFVIACTPFVLTALQKGVKFESKAAPDEIPHNVRIVALSTQSVIVTWDTQAPKIGATRYGIFPVAGKVGIVVIGDNGQKVEKHTIKLESLQYGSSYYVDIYSGNRWYDNNGEQLQFTFR
jgi:hypothetical protein